MLLQFDGLRFFLWNQFGELVLTLADRSVGERQVDRGLASLDMPSVAILVFPDRTTAEVTRSWRLHAFHEASLPEGVDGQPLIANAGSSAITPQEDQFGRRVGV